MDRLIFWFLFAAVFRLLPIALNAYRLWINAQVQNQSANWFSHSIANGELFLLATLLCGVGLGRLIGSGSEFRATKYVVGFSTLCCAIISVSIYVDMIAPNRRPGVRGTRLMRNMSLGAFFSAVILSGICEWLGDE